MLHQHHLSPISAAHLHATEAQGCEIAATARATLETAHVLTVAAAIVVAVVGLVLPVVTAHGTADLRARDVAACGLVWPGGRADAELVAISVARGAHSAVCLRTSQGTGRHTLLAVAQQLAAAIGADSAGATRVLAWADAVTVAADGVGAASKCATLAIDGRVCLHNSAHWLSAIDNLTASTLAADETRIPSV